MQIGITFPGWASELGNTGAGADFAFAIQKTRVDQRHT
jgi:hypothetical protein